MENENHNRIQAEVDKTMALLSELERPTTSDDFYERLQAKIANTTEDQPTIVRPMYRVKKFYWAAAAIAILLVNSATLFTAYSSEESTDSRDDQIESLIEDYSLRTENPYNV